MRVLICVAMVAGCLAACGGDSKTATTPTTAPCSTPPAGPQFATVYSATPVDQTQGMLTGVQATTGTCSDTATFTFNGADVPGYEVKYVQAATQCGSGEPVTTAGAAQISVRFSPAVAHDEEGHPSVSQQAQTPNFTSIKELESSCDFEAVVVWIIGTEAKYYTVTKVTNPSRLVIEVAH